ncbi:MAG: hypothetical protein Q8P28_04865 [Deltaproteobacteria bacterium]|nr:hypothetical protein [Deltaproteobacteria bacterium]
MRFLVSSLISQKFMNRWKGKKKDYGMTKKVFLDETIYCWFIQL